MECIPRQLACRSEPSLLSNGPERPWPQ